MDIDFSPKEIKTNATVFKPPEVGQWVSELSILPLSTISNLRSKKPYVVKLTEDKLGDWASLPLGVTPSTSQLKDYNATLDITLRPPMPQF